MIKVLEVQQQFNKPENHQSRIIECESFEDYLQNIDTSLPRKEVLEMYKKIVNHQKKTITFSFEHKLGEAWYEFTHFAQVIEDLGNVESKTFDVMVDDDNVNIIDWIYSKFENGNDYKHFELNIAVREFEYEEFGDKLYIG